MIAKTQQKRFKFFIFIVLCFFITATGYYLTQKRTKTKLRKIAQKNDPSDYSLASTSSSYIRWTNLEESGIQCGIIQLKDDSTSKFWFLSHHLTDDFGGTWFHMSDGQWAYMSGNFCCEVILPEMQSLQELRDYIKTNHGTPP